MWRLLLIVVELDDMEQETWCLPLQMPVVVETALRRLFVLLD